MTNDKSTRRGGFRPNSGRHKLPPGQARTHRMTVSTAPAIVAEVQAVVKPKSMSLYVSDLITTDLEQRRRERYARAIWLNCTGRVVSIRVPLDDVPLWTWQRWQTRHVDDIESAAELCVECDTYAEADELYTQVNRLIGGAS